MEFERLKKRLIEEINHLVKLKEEKAPLLVIENDFIDFQITKDAFIQSMGCRKEPDVYSNGVLHVGKIVCTKKEDYLQN